MSRVSVPGSSVSQSREARGYSQFQVEKPVAPGWEEATFKGMCLLAGSSVGPGFLLEKSQLLAETKTIPGHSLAGERWKRGEAGSASGSLSHPLIQPQKPPCFPAGGEGGTSRQGFKHFTCRVSGSGLEKRTHRLMGRGTKYAPGSVRTWMGEGAVPTSS